MSQDAYGEFLALKAVNDPAAGLDVVPTVSDTLMDFQRDITRWALRRGRACVFADCGLGKTPIQLEWARHVPGRTLILAPLAVSAQTVREAVKFDVPDVAYLRSDNQEQRIVVTNYEMLDRFNPDNFSGVVLDESSILKSYDGQFRKQVIDSFQRTQFRLACTATPAPNDLMEIANHAEFVGAMTRVEMLAMFFTHDGGETSKWRLKRHGQSDFWKWMASWAVMLRRPSDLGYEDNGFILPPLDVKQITVSAESDGLHLFPMEAQTLSERLSARRASIDDRVQASADIVNGSGEQFLVWCNLNSESSALKAAIPGATEVKGSDSQQHKETSAIAFQNGEIRVLISKPSIFGYGMNWQNCHNAVFVGLSDSWEQYYQAVRRIWRFGQQSPVKVYVVTAETEGAVVTNINRKEAAAARMAEGMVEHMKDLNSQQLHGGTMRSTEEYKMCVRSGDGWTMHLADCVDVTRELPDDSVHYTIYSPPFASLYTYSNSPRDMGNCHNADDFMEHYRFMVKELYRATMPGRLVSFHCMNLPIRKQMEGYIGIRDFRGELIRLHMDEGWIYHSEVCIWKDPVTAMQRTKALGLLHKQIKKDSCMSRQGIADYLVTMRKPGENPERVTHTNESFPVSLWQRYASPVWTDINPSDTLQYRSARENGDERHICPLQLEVIRRGVRLWSNPGDTVFSPFAGIGSEGWVALGPDPENGGGRHFVGVELKSSYFEQACRNLAAARQQESLSLISHKADELETA